MSFDYLKKKYALYTLYTHVTLWLLPAWHWINSFFILKIYVKRVFNELINTIVQIMPKHDDFQLRMYLMSIKLNVWLYIKYTNKTQQNIFNLKTSRNSISYQKVVRASYEITKQSTKVT